MIHTYADTIEMALNSPADVRFNDNTLFVTWKLGYTVTRGLRTPPLCVATFQLVSHAMLLSVTLVVRVVLPVSVWYSEML